MIRTSFTLPLFLVVCGLFSGETSAWAKAPTVDFLYPGGGVRGSTVEVEVGGQFERWPLRVWTSNPGLVVIPSKDKGKIKVELGRDLVPGVYWIRFYDEEGTATPRPFVVGTIPEALENEPNDEVAKANRLDTSGVTFNGRLQKNGDVDSVRVTLKKGQTVVAALEAHDTLGSPMDGMLQAASSDGFVLAQVDDSPDRDPRLVFEAPRDGDFIIRVFAFPYVQASSIQFSGAPGYVYRLTVTARGYADHVWPLSVTTGHSAEATLRPEGWNLLPGLALNVPASPDTEKTLSLWHPEVANRVSLRQVRAGSVVESEPNDRKQPQQVKPPLALSGRVDTPRDVDYYAFVASKGETWPIKIRARQLGSPLDAVLRVHDHSGKVLSEDDDSAKDVDPELKFVAPADGTYLVSVRDLTDHGSRDHVYLLEMAEPEVDYALSLKADPVVLTAGKPFDLTVQVERTGGFAESVEIQVEGRPEGLVVEPVISHKTGPSASSVTLKLTACECLAPGPIRVVGVSREGRTRRARVPVSGLTGQLDHVWLTLAKPAPAPAAGAEKPKP